MRRLSIQPSLDEERGPPTDSACAVLFPEKFKLIENIDTTRSSMYCGKSTYDRPRCRFDDYLLTRAIASDMLKALTTSCA